MIFRSQIFKAINNIMARTVKLVMKMRIATDDLTEFFGFSLKDIEAVSEPRIMN